ncbi:MAG: hypothetical protein Q4F00_02945 [bacterium]|nr:hypothetical protein [bacterium]
MSARKVTVVRYLFALSDHKVWAYIVREDPTVFDLKRLDGVECQDPSQAPGQMEGYLQQWKNAMSLNSQEFPQGHTYQGKSGQLPSLEGRSVCLLSDSSDPALVIEMTGILDELWQASAASRNQYEDIPWKQEDFQTFLDLQEQPFGPGLRLKDVKNDALVTVTSLNAKGWLGLKIYGSLDKGLTPALRQSSSAAKVMVPRQPSSVAKAIAPPPESPSTAPQRPEKQPSAESKP